MVSAPRQSYRPDIDGLRAIAVLTVVLYHAGVPGIAGGYVGVDVFFVISGFLITRLLAAEVEKTGDISLLQFYARRARRLFPAFAVVILTTIAIWTAFLLGVKADTQRFIESVQYSVFGAANFFFQANTGGYFDGASEQMPLLHMWSLAVEEQFYLVWPMLVLMTAPVLIRRKRGTKAVRSASRMRPVIVFSLLIVLSLILSALLVSYQAKNAAFYLMPARAWELGVGALLSYLESFVQKGTRSLGASARRIRSDGLAVFGLGAIAWATTVYDGRTPFPYPGALPPVIGASLVILSGSIWGGGSVTRLLSSRIMVGVGLLSYGWYLWHWPLLAMARTWTLGELPGPWVRFAIVLGSLGLAALSLKFIEAPIRHGSYARRGSPKQVLFITAACSAVIAGLVALIPFFERPLSPRITELRRLATERPPLEAECDKKLENIGSGMCTLRFASQGSEPRASLVMWGNSYATHFFPMMIENAKANALETSLFAWTGGIPGLLYSPGVLKDEHTSEVRGMRQYHEHVMRSLEDQVKRTEGRPVSLVLASRWTQIFGDQPMSATGFVDFLDTARTRSGTQEIIRTGLRNTLTRLSMIGIHRVLILMPYVEFRYSIHRCLLRDINSCAVSLTRLEEYRSDLVKMIQEVSRDFPNVRWLDVVPAFCEGGICPQTIPHENREIPVVIDTEHPSVEAAKFIAQRFKADLDWLSER